MSDMDREVMEKMDSTEPRQRGETRKLEQGAEAPMPRPRRAETQKLDSEPELSLQPANPAAYLGLTREEMNWAALAHASILVTFLLGVLTGGLAALLGPIIPAIIWYSFREKSDYVADQARQATIYQVAAILALLGLALLGAILLAVGWVVSAVLVIVLIGILLMLVMLVVTLLWAIGLVALPIAAVVYGCYAALEAYNGRPFRYRWVADLIDRYETQA